MNRPLVKPMFMTIVARSPRTLLVCLSVLFLSACSDTELKEKLSAAEKTIAEQTAKLVTLEETLKSQKSSGDTDKIEVAKVLTATLQSQLSEVKQDLTASKDALGIAEKSLAETQTQNQALTQSVKELQQQLDNASADIKTIDPEIETEIASISEIFSGFQFASLPDAASDLAITDAVNQSSTNTEASSTSTDASSIATSTSNTDTTEATTSDTMTAAPINGKVSPSAFVKQVSQQLTKAKETFDQVTTKNQTLSKELDELQQKVHQLSEENQLLAENRSAFESQMEKFEQATITVEELRQNHDKTQSELEQKLSLLNETQQKSIALETALLSANEDLSRTSSALQQREEEIAQITTELNNFKSNMSEELGQREVTIKQLKDRSTLIQLGSDLVYSIGSTRLKEQGKSVLDQVQSLLAQYPDYTVSLEGHTDNIPVKANISRFPSNWELSTARAAAAANYLKSVGVDPKIIRVSGFGEYRPLTDNATVEGRAKNRRLEILLIPDQEVKSIQ